MWPLKGKNLGRFVLKRSLLNFLFKKYNRHTFNVVGIKIKKERVIREAISNYLKTISIDLKDEVLYCNLEKVHYGQGNHEKAIDHVKSALKLKSDVKAAQDLTSEIESSILALRKKRLNDAGVDAVHRWANKVMPRC
jgi:tetratricopeptide (TPR) repeat protein